MTVTSCIDSRPFLSVSYIVNTCLRSLMDSTVKDRDTSCLNAVQAHKFVKQLPYLSSSPSVCEGARQTGRCLAAYSDTCRRLVII